MSVRAAAIIAAGGFGRRMRGVRKQYLELAGEPVLLRSVRPFLTLEGVRWVVVALPTDEAASPPSWLVGADRRIIVVTGGRTRGESVANALKAVPEEVDVVLVHDAARPLVTVEVVERVMDAAARGVGAVAAMPVTDTIKEVDEAGRILATPPRDRLWRAQTPQGFPRSMLVEAYERAAADGITATDDSALVERYGGIVTVVRGSEYNLKVTHPADLPAAEAVLIAHGRAGGAGGSGAGS